MKPVVNKLVNSVCINMDTTLKRKLKVTLRIASDNIFVCSENFLITYFLHEWISYCNTFTCSYTPCSQKTNSFPRFQTRLHFIELAWDALNAVKRSGVRDAFLYSVIHRDEFTTTTSSIRWCLRYNPLNCIAVTVHLPREQDWRDFFRQCQEKFLLFFFLFFCLYEQVVSQE